MSGAWGKLQYESWDHEKVEAVENRAWGAFLRAVAWSGQKRKDGWVTAAAMRKIERDARVWTRLEEAGMLEGRTVDGAWLHDWSDHNETTARRAEREESYSRRGKAGAEAKHRGGSKQTPSNDGEQPEVERSRSDKRREDQTREDEDRASAPSSVIAQRSDDPYGIAPPGENPDAYPGSVEAPPPLTLTPPTPAATSKPRKGKGPRPDLDPTTLTPEAFAAYEAIRTDPTFGPITVRPAEAARDFAALYPRLDLAQAIREIGTKVRASDRTYVNGAATLANWLPNSRCYRTAESIRAAAKARETPPAPAPTRRTGPPSTEDPVEDQIAYFVWRKMPVPQLLLDLRAKELEAAKAKAAADDAPPVVGPLSAEAAAAREDSEVPF